MGAVTAAGGPSPGQVRLETEALLLRVVTAGRVAEVLWRLRHTGQRTRRREHPVEVGGEQDSALIRLAWQRARVAIDATVHGDRPEVYHAAVGAACRTDDPGLTALVLAELASMHLRCGYPDDSQRLVELAETHEQQQPGARDGQAGHDNDREQPGWQ